MVTQKFRGGIRIKKLRPEDALKLSCLLNSAAPEYAKYFTPFSFNFKSILAILKKAKLDRYFGVSMGRRLVGFYMLRGFDGGYTTPSYGVWIAPEYSRKGLAKLTLSHAFAFCKLHRINKLMLKVYLENAVAKKFFEKNGFVLFGADPQNNKLIYYKTFNKEKV